MSLFEFITISVIIAIGVMVICGAYLGRKVNDSMGIGPGPEDRYQ